jgi:adenosylhomocysteine nucleosidase
MNDFSKPTRSVGWAFLFALRRESEPFGRRLQLVHPLPDAPCPAARVETHRGAAVILETGIGVERAATAARWALEQFEPRLVVACGFAGALSPSLKVGDVLLASEVLEPGEDELNWRTAVPAELGDLPVRRLVTVQRLVATQTEKQALARQTHAVMVDMESAAIAEACQEWNVPCAVVRVISDTAATALSPRLVNLLSGGRASPWRVLWAVARSPRLIIEIWRLARDTRLAAHALASALAKIVDK